MGSARSEAGTLPPRVRGRSRNTRLARRALRPRHSYAASPRLGDTHQETKPTPFIAVTESALRSAWNSMWFSPENNTSRVP
ncbi:hypothetical protein PC121_g24369 [Phytophthora cactorum]|nr:hypothetical protein PC120_g27132 [Phytophthora cactorum]KAG3033112.1 hypothetical protein PC121_g24369 [Phytophthora cactorum]KAG4036971.1 hypothetical protein PC123_g27461 [Phytophthora cactorum]